uniref:Uncharacterized protein n=1 Tax=Aegilops tauschii subsp. strangulata TaxID=200361 RepID=A0A453J9X8_AEGTS
KKGANTKTVSDSAKQRGRRNGRARRHATPPADHRTVGRTKEKHPPPARTSPSRSIRPPSRSPPPDAGPGRGRLRLRGSGPSAGARRRRGRLLLRRGRRQAPLPQRLLQVRLRQGVKVWLGENADHYYVLSRFLLSRMLTV